ncbi:Gfo/Idh/MocA family protein [Metabacillus sp. RGM 3146]|uniref:Gfo/Idh/MocA family protein n=1 Tax=Metabacillus sp. RGM 3146 TaxID=3401092 RepID=UPI003B9B6C05
MSNLNIAMIGLDTSHAEIFTKLLLDKEQPHKVKGAKITAAFPGGSEDFPLSRNRVNRYTSLLKKEYGVSIFKTPEAAAENADAIWITAVDGRVHEKLFESISHFKKPVFIDKPFALSSDAANRMIRLAKEKGIPLMSSSSLRFDETLNNALDGAKEKLIGADCYGPMELQETQSGLFWYGIHTAEMLYRILGAGCVRVSARCSADFETITGEWKDGRFGTMRGARKGHGFFGALLHYEDQPRLIEIQKTEKPYYVSLLEKMVVFSETGKADPVLNETAEVIRFLEAANESREKDGKWIHL